MKSIYTALGLALLSLQALSAQDPAVFMWRDTFCGNQLVLVNNNFYGPDHPSGTEILPGAAANGGDSIIQVDFYFFAPVVLNVEQDLCSNDTVWFNDSPYHAMRWLGEETLSNAAANGCDSVIRIRLNILPAPASTLSDTLCSGDFRVVNGRRFDRDHPSGMELLPGAATNGCDSIVHIDLIFNDPQVSLGPDRSVALGDTLCLNAWMNFVPDLVEWMPEAPCSTAACASWCMQPVGDTPILVRATDSAGCTVADTLAISVFIQERIYIPNVFDPGADSANKYFFIGTDQAVSGIRQLLILDRWGDLVFYREHFPPNVPEEGWDGFTRNGAAAPQGVYVYKVVLEMADGSLVDRRGDVTLLRSKAP